MNDDFHHRTFQRAGLYNHYRNWIDIPTANTIIIERADHFGLRLHQLRGRVGRSHHQAYASAADAASKSDDYRCTKKLLKRLPRWKISVGLRWQRTIWRFAARVNCLAKNKAAQWSHRFLAADGVAGKPPSIGTESRTRAVAGDIPTSQQTEVSYGCRRYCQMISFLTRIRVCCR